MAVRTNVRDVTDAGAFPPPGGLPTPDAPAPVQWGAPQVPPGYQAAPPPGYPAYPAYQPYPAQGGTSAYAVLALIFGIVPVMCGALGVIFGIVALERNRSLGHSGRGLAISGIVLGSIWLVIWVIIAIAVFAA